MFAVDCRAIVLVPIFTSLTIFSSFLALGFIFLLCLEVNYCFQENLKLLQQSILFFSKAIFRYFTLLI